MGFNVNDIKQHGAECLTIHSFETGIYLVEATLAQQVGFITDDAGNNLRFSSVNEVKDVFCNSAIGQYWLVAETAFDEMVGLAEGAKTQLRIPL